ncbi:serine/threonine protein kinase PSK1 SCDLUD_000486 [Saccharomycodes ludwigii]|uniref:serine/threonine protein kinase PSK1 n=1 Tax=Saccharomycodes ludwigii TaxID=36035 RepID=UPI001E86B57B|nr:hypothetical protein SCDLUD_000486 [Saccharomycodes ludwigii]KAH3902891.1 hypothetical protein SCDLUD_000486 [Saccharomycodes ludwigii]
MLSKSNASSTLSLASAENNKKKKEPSTDPFEKNPKDSVKSLVNSNDDVDDFNEQENNSDNEEHDNTLQFNSKVLPKIQSTGSNNTITTKIATTAATTTINATTEKENSKADDLNIDELIKFPTQSTHAYSYNPLSPNSLSVRLNILKRTLEIMIRNPSLIKDPQPWEPHLSSSLEQEGREKVNRDQKIINLIPTTRENSITSGSDVDDNSYDAKTITGPKDSKRDFFAKKPKLNAQPNSLRTASSAALNAFFQSGTANSTNTNSNASLNPPSLTRRSVSDFSLHTKKNYSNFNRNLDNLLENQELKGNNNETSDNEDALEDSSFHQPQAPYASSRKNSRDSVLPSPYQYNNTDGNNNTIDHDVCLSNESSDVESTPNGALNGKDFYQNKESVDSAEFLKAKKVGLESLLSLLNETLSNNKEDSDKVSSLHMMSLLNINKLSVADNDSGYTAKHTEILKKNLLNSLAQPFFESYSEYVEEENKILEMENGLEAAAISAEKRSSPYMDTQRVFHTFTSGKNSTPQAIFTCTDEHPWEFKSANDLACLTFGVSKLALRALTLLDLIHKDSRNFVLNKLLSTEGEEQVFTGEIVGTNQPNGGNSTSSIIWTSLWAKRKNNLIVCVFQRVPCDYFDLMISMDDFSVTSVVGGEALRFKDKIAEQAQVPETNEKDIKKSVKFIGEITKISQISHSISKLIDDLRNNEGGGITDNNTYVVANEPISIKIANTINDIRYFTLNHLSYNIPCAATCFILQDELKLKIHTLPYIAGVFVVDSINYTLISFNKSISKNLFGIHARDLVGKSIVEIIPVFPKLIEYIKTYYPKYDTNNNNNKNLVLTEHFFRKIQAEFNGHPEDFYSSIGLDAVHRDGSIIKVDIQLRVINAKYFVLWITHSRDVVLKNYNTLPSQLSILKDEDIKTIGSRGSSASSSKRNTDNINVKDFKKTDKQHLKLDELDALLNDLDKKEKSKKPTSKFKQPALLSLSSASSAISLPDSANPKAASTSNLLLQHSDEEGDSNGCRVATKKAGGDRNLLCKSQTHTGGEETPDQLAKKYSQSKTNFVKDSNFKFDDDYIMNVTSRIQSRDISKISLVPESNGDSSTYENLYDTGTTHFKLGALKHKKKFTDFIVLQKMGEGAYGKVDLCMHKKLKYIVVVKRIIKERILVDTWVRDRTLGTIPSEIQIMATLNKTPHENIMYLLDFFEDDDFYYIETPIHGETGSIDLFDLIELKTDMSEHEAKLLFKQIVSGVRHLHSHGIVHRDIKDENVIVDNKGFVKIIDFGSAAYVRSGPFDVFVGTMDYAAAEVLSGEPYEGKPQDIWALGVLLYTIVFKENPFYNIDEILDGSLRIPNNNVSADCITLIHKILNRSVSKRLNIEEIFNDKWLEL